MQYALTTRRRTIVAAIVALTLAITSLGITQQAEAHERDSERRVSWANVEQEISQPDAPDPTTENIGWSRLERDGSGLRAKLLVRGLQPGGVYTFWWVVPQTFTDGGDPVIPDGVFVAYGNAVVVGDSGMAFVEMRARRGQHGIEGFPPIGDAEWDHLRDPLNAVVRVEIAYHGQAEDADKDELETWTSDFWTGTACPETGDLNAGGQPHCPVYLAATHLP